MMEVGQKSDGNMLYFMKKQRKLKKKDVWSTAFIAEARTSSVIHYIEIKNVFLQNGLYWHEKKQNFT
jgi:hypothetical protein